MRAKTTYPAIISFASEVGVVCRPASSTSVDEEYLTLLLPFLPLALNNQAPKSMTTASRNPEESPSSSKTAEIDAPLHAIGFHIDVVSPSLVNGRFTVSHDCCQPFGVLHGGVSALVAEALASIGAHVASGFRRIAGVQLSINHHRPAALGDQVLTEARPINVGRTIQVWEVQLWKVPADQRERKEKGPLLASSRVTLLTNLPVPEEARHAGEKLRKHARL